jgi:hypothetical protein
VKTTNLTLLEFSVLLISSWIEAWFVAVVPGCLNRVALPQDLLTALMSPSSGLQGKEHFQHRQTTRHCRHEEPVINGLMTSSEIESQFKFTDVSDTRTASIFSVNELAACFCLVASLRL